MSIPTLIKIFDAAYQLMGEKGYDKMSMNAIAAGASITKPSLYYYFNSKEALILGLLNEISKTIDLGKQYKLQEWTPDNYAIRFRALGRVMIEEYKEDILFSKVMKQFGILSLSNEVIGAKLAEITDTQRTHFEKILRHGASCGVVDPASIEYCIDLLIMVIRTIGDEITINADKAYSEIWTLAIKGVISHRMGY